MWLKKVLKIVNIFSGLNILFKLSNDITLREIEPDVDNFFGWKWV